jgi:hypothetical protein
MGAEEVCGGHLQDLAIRKKVEVAAPAMPGKKLCWDYNLMTTFS